MQHAQNSLLLIKQARTMLQQVLALSQGGCCDQPCCAACADAPESAAACLPHIAILAPAAAPSAGSSPGEAGWQLVLLQEKGAQEELAELILRQDWHAALALTQRHGLPTDRVLKCAQVTCKHDPRS